MVPRLHASQAEQLVEQPSHVRRSGVNPGQSLVDWERTLTRLHVVVHLVLEQIGPHDNRCQRVLQIVRSHCEQRVLRANRVFEASLVRGQRVSFSTQRGEAGSAGTRDHVHMVEPGVVRRQVRMSRDPQSRKLTKGVWALATAVGLGSDSDGPTFVLAAHLSDHLVSARRLPARIRWTMLRRVCSRIGLVT